MSPRRDGGPDRSPQLTVVAVIFGVAGVLGLLVGLFATIFAVGVFGVIALVVSGLVYTAQRMRERSAIETEQTLGVGPLLSPSERMGPGPDYGPDRGAAPMDEMPESDEPEEQEDEADDAEEAEEAEEEGAEDGGSSGSGPDDRAEVRGAGSGEEETRSLSQEDDGYGGRPGDQAGPNVGAATATDLESDPETGRPLSPTSDGEEGGDGGEGRVGVADGAAAQGEDGSPEDGSPEDGDGSAELSAEARTRDGAG